MRALSASANHRISEYHRINRGICFRLIGRPKQKSPKYRRAEEAHRKIEAVFIAIKMRSPWRRRVGIGRHISEIGNRRETGVMKASWLAQRHRRTRGIELY